MAYAHLPNPRAIDLNRNQNIVGRRLQRITEWASWAHAANYCVHTLADCCGVSTRTLDRNIKLRFGICPQQYLRNLRMQRALELLSEDASVKETAAALGYKSQQHFSREFKKYVGYPPSQTQNARR